MRHGILLIRHVGREGNEVSPIVLIKQQQRRERTMFSNVLRNIDTKLLRQQEKTLIDLIKEEQIPMNHPLVGLLGLVTGLLIERAAGQNRVDVSMNYWTGGGGELCINFHPSLYSISPVTKTALCSGLLLSTLPQSKSIEDFMDRMEDLMGKTVLVRFGDSIVTEE